MIHVVWTMQGEVGAELHPGGSQGWLSEPPSSFGRWVSFLPLGMPDIVKCDPSGGLLALDITLRNDYGHPCLQISTQRTRRKCLAPVTQLSRLGSGI